MIRLPRPVQACLFDLDGVLTDTASVHAAAWKEMFDKFLQAWSAQHGQPFVPFDPVKDYDTYVDGKPRADGTRSFLKSRGIELPEGDPHRPADLETIVGLGNTKNAIVLRRIHTDGVRAYPGSVRFVQEVKAAGIRRAVVSSSTNCHDVLVAAGIAHLFDGVVDGVVTEREHLAGKPAPDTYLAGAKLLGVAPADAAVFEDALAGVESGKAGNFGVVVGVDRVGQAEELKAHGATVVVTDLDQLLG